MPENYVRTISAPSVHDLRREYFNIQSILHSRILKAATSRTTSMLEDALVKYVESQGTNELDRCLCLYFDELNLKSREVDPNCGPNPTNREILILLDI